MELNLTGAALRVLGSLVEKERTTPEYYPLSVNALMNACNQKSNRDPVMSLTEADVMLALDELRGAGLAVRSADGGRVSRYGHNLIGKLQVSVAETALLAELLLRGPQTVGELRTRAERMSHFADPGEIDAALTHLAEHEPPLVMKLPRQPGRKESRWQQLLGAASPAEEGGDGEQQMVEAVHRDRPAPQSGAQSGEQSGDRMARLEEEVTGLRAEVERIWKVLQSLTPPEE